MVERARQLVSEADELKDSGRRMAAGEGGTLRVGMGSGPGAMLMTPLLMRMATDYPRLRLVVARGGTELLAQALRARALDVMAQLDRAPEPLPATAPVVAPTSRAAADVATATRRCPACQTENDGDARFCKQCGGRLGD